MCRILVHTYVISCITTFLQYPFRMLSFCLLFCNAAISWQLHLSLSAVRLRKGATVSPIFNVFFFNFIIEICARSSLFLLCGLTLQSMQFNHIIFKSFVHTLHKTDCITITSPTGYGIKEYNSCLFCESLKTRVHTTCAEWAACNIKTDSTYRNQYASEG